MYSLLPLVASIALTGVYVFVADVSAWLKALVVGLLVASLLWRHGFFLQAGLSISLSFYFACLKARYTTRG